MKTSRTHDLCPPNVMAGNLDCQETFRRIGDLVGPSIAAKLTPFANAYRKGLYCDGIWSCEGIVDISMKPYEVREGTSRADCE